VPPPAEIIDAEGEGFFRGLERRALERAGALQGAVIGTGGGTPLDPLNRWLLMEHGLRVRLDAPIDRLAHRLTSDGVSRPLLGADLVAGLRRTAESRAAVYRAVDATVDADAPLDHVAGLVVDSHARRPAGVAQWRPLYDAPFRRQHPLGPAEGRVLFGRGLTASALAAALAPWEGRRPAVVADSAALTKLPGLLAALPDGRLLAIRGGESAKTFDRLQQLLEWLSVEGAERSDPLLAVGGGTIGDVAGLAAALHRRGMPLVHLPTTWLAQADSAHGGKAAIDLPMAKNAVGAFWPPALTIADTSLLASLPVEARRDGMAEVLKSGLIGDPALWDLAETRGTAALSGEDEAAVYAMTERAARVKLAIVERDPYEDGERRVLNLGHTLGHAFEVESGYRLGHGSAVALGLRAVAGIAARRGAQAGLRERIDDVLDRLGFPLRHRFDAGAVVGALGGDKKRDRGRQRWILPMAVGRVEEVDDVTPDELGAALREVSA
jgi:shikimate kinase / 3-dehydroquinate synthase